MIMTHSDEDHISGQLELLQNCSNWGLSIGCYLMPELSEMSRTENDRKLQEAAVLAKVPIRYINAGDCIKDGKLSLLCLHPKRGFSGASANACSTVLNLSYGSFTMLLTGDLEKEGEEALCQLLAGTGGQDKISDFLPEQYDVLKVAHHGSKNSTAREILSYLSPKAALISCGRKNRYRHPHKELLERLEAYTSRIFRTDEGGAIQIRSDGRDFYINCYHISL